MEHFWTFLLLVGGVLLGLLVNSYTGLSHLFRTAGAAPAPIANA